jgi:MinD-like ATPase involved in chromosome partitioning or flagellar assembly
VFDVTIKNAANYQEAIADRRPITHYKPKSEFAMAFRRLMAELDEEPVYAQH